MSHVEVRIDVKKVASEPPSYWAFVAPVNHRLSVVEKVSLPLTRTPGVGRPRPPRWIKYAGPASVGSPLSEKPTSDNW